MKYIEIKSPDKINIGLDIVSKRADGYHNLQTIFYPLFELYDVIIIEKSNEFMFRSNLEEINDSSNLVVKAKSLLEKKFSKKMDVKITLEKNIPIGAGLGGGSSNAASVLLALNDMFNLKMNHDVLIKYALELGSDVPFFIKARPSIGESRGEVLTEINLEINNSILIVNPRIHISTKDAFNNISPINPLIDYKTLLESELNNIMNYKNIFKNDFEGYVFNKYPAVAEIKEILYEEGAVFSLMSGSGSTVYGIFNDLESMASAKKKLPSNYLCIMLRGNF